MDRLISDHLLGYNPGGEPGSHTIYRNAENLLHNLPANYSAYRDEEWSPGGRRHAIGLAPMQQRVRYLLDRLDLDPGEVPTSNVIYARSRRVAPHGPRTGRRVGGGVLAFHARMIERLGVKVVVCLGGSAA